MPRDNLITNLGFDEGATHTSDVNSWMAHLTANDIEIPGQKEKIRQNKKADLFSSRKVFEIRSTGRQILSDLKRVIITQLKQKQ